MILLDQWGVQSFSAVFALAAYGAFPCPKCYPKLWRFCCWFQMWLYMLHLPLLMIPMNYCQAELFCQGLSWSKPPAGVVNLSASEVLWEHVRLIVFWWWCSCRFSNFFQCGGMRWEFLGSTSHIIQSLRIHVWNIYLHWDYFKLL